MPRSIAYARLIAGFVLPHNLVEWIRHRRARKQAAIDYARADAFKRTVSSLARPAAVPYSRSEAVSFLSGLGCDRLQVEAGSMPESSLIRLRRPRRSWPGWSIQPGQAGIGVCGVGSGVIDLGHA